METRADLLNKADGAAGSMSGCYQRLGEFCLIIRTDKETGNFRFIYPHIMGAVELSEFLRKCSDAAFNGGSFKTTGP